MMVKILFKMQLNQLTLMPLHGDLETIKEKLSPLDVGILILAAVRLKYSI